MADPKGFLKYTRELPNTRDPQERIKDYKELYEDFEEEKTVKQAARCMDCGVPFCHSGCPLGNIIPEFNDAVYEEDWQLAYEILSSTNNFPEFTGRICPAPCETACVLGINQPPVAIEHIEKSIAEVAFEKGYVRPQPPTLRTGKKVAIVGSGPAGLAAAAQLNKVGHLVTVFERNDRIGGLLRYGIPDFKLEKFVVERRVALMEAEGIRFRINANVGGNVDPQELMDQYDAVLLCGGSTIPRNLNIEGRELEGVHFAMDFLEQNNRRVAGDAIPDVETITAKGKHVVVIGGGDTGSDCVGTSNRHGAKSVTQIELMDRPPNDRDPLTWPNWPVVLRTSTSHEEGCERQWSLLTKAFTGENGKVTGLKLVQIEWAKNSKTGKYGFLEVEGTEQEIPCDLALLAIGFLSPQYRGMLEKLGVEIDERGNVRDEDYRTNLEKVFVAGDMRRGQSLVVWAIAEGREAARSVDKFLMGESNLEARDKGFLMAEEY
ncbi:glutamate synthase subunit beta [Phaeodactylibacter sp.]|jgi:glutamate synthase (NADPH/NADH) small chain|uniref:glutamate synthase subunit beta n=1 Tax=Phaeodactylibacter sp. TaxID=1940289 RepID=UPI0025F571EB|nr:glutamate synthase subunit beta [Phaeodactylibacter sp.]MCI4648413.1 glutamate synthase subunit beta [Phaeodactylibacter sp.]MCI5092522.1 glutamate synthase subunit beta [Phaeodactylibacter sp.]